MSDLGLDLRSHSEADEPPRRRRRRNRRRLVAVLVVLAVLGVLIGGAVVGGSRLLAALGAVPDYPGPGGATVVIQVRPGDSLADIGVTVADRGVVKSGQAFREAAKKRPDARSVSPGFYRLRARMSGAGAVALLLDPTARVKSRVTIPEGLRLTGIVDLTARNTEIPLADLQAAAANPAALGLPDYARGRLEGLLFPATYDFPPGTTGVQALSVMASRFSQEALDLQLESGAAALGRSPYDVVVVASLVEKEARLPEDFGKVAQVAYNRLMPAWNRPFGFDSTINYALPDRAGNLAAKDLAVDSPYNSRTHKGLPPTAIDSPGRPALMAALHPTPGPWLFFVTIDQAGHTAFETTIEAFDKDVATSRANGVR